MEKSFEGISNKRTINSFPIIMLSIMLCMAIICEHSRNELWTKGVRTPTDFSKFKCRSEGMTKFVLL